jgi:hypothetical protein
MDEVFERPYIPQLDTQKEQQQLYKLKDFRANQSYSRDKHNKQRAASHRLKKKKESLISIYNNKPLFIFKLLDDNIRIVDNTLKTKLNTVLEKYEQSTLDIRRCKNDESLEVLCKKLNKMCENIEKHINKDNFIDYVIKNCFINSNNVNLNNDPEYAELINITLKEKADKMKEMKLKSDKYAVKKNISFADMLKRNL